MKKGIELRVVGIGLVIAGVLFALAVPTSLMGQEAAEAAKSMRLKLKVLKTYPQPVIDEKTPGVEGIKGGYECGNTVKVMIDGKPEYHFFAWRMPGLGWENLGTDQLV